MNTSIVGKQFDLTEPIKAYVNGAVDALGKYNLDIISVRTVISADEKNGKKGFNVEFAINMAHKNTVVIQQKDKDVYAAVDLAIERAKKVLRRHHDKITNYKAEELVVIEENSEGSDDEIVPIRLDSYKPVEVEDAMNELKASDKQFIVFHDMEDKFRVMYKKTDGRFGLY
ncbi:ribosome hibernation-promoting factor, HPF/YfiA family [Sulfurospirillum halorespirans]|uniref:Ribosome hibernation promoting factor n=1 Tax=Sulfurospirillum halorespirans DSM 13726 TaxID=1193502 RepID=A0A1D7TIS4_9BACT|nr:ribosome-associated translation inhibitor RaiA [Sulfurospirillum halorespirans]AOO64891.1 putative ribosomal subunit interface protein [Sulfurospirillum halorespirans DSM 13726]